MRVMTQPLVTRARLALMSVAIFVVPSSGQQLEYPKTRKTDQVDDYHGTRVADPYRWLEDDNYAETAKWVEAENKVTFAGSQVPEYVACFHHKACSAESPGLRIPTETERYALIFRRGRAPEPFPENQSRNNLDPHANECSNTHHFGQRK